MKIIILASGTGSIFEAVAKACRRGVIDAEVALLVCNRPEANVLTKAAELKIPTRTLNPKDFDNEAAWDEELAHVLKKYDPDLIFLAGFLKRLGPKVLAAFPNKILNTHPSLLPRHGGAGMYGRFVHRAVIEAKDQETGISLHVVTHDYDQGPVIAQMNVPVFENESPEQLEDRVKYLERRFVVDNLQKLSRGELSLIPKTT